MTVAELQDVLMRLDPSLEVCVGQHTEDQFNGGTFVSPEGAVEIRIDLKNNRVVIVDEERE